MGWLDRLLRKQRDSEPELGHETINDDGFHHAADATPDEVPPPVQDPHLIPKRLLPPGFPPPGAG